MKPPDIIPLNETTLLLQWNRLPGPDLLQHLLAVQQCLDATPFPGFLETVLAFNSMAVFYNPLLLPPHKNETCFEQVCSYIVEKLQQLPVGQQGSGKKITIPVCYDAVLGPDLEQVAQRHGLDAATIIQLHTQTTYHVYATAFMPGFPYMGFVPPGLQVPRHNRPRPHVPAGSVAIAGKQTGIYPFDSPGGWNIIGRTPVRLFDPGRNPAFLLEAGDEVQFEAITTADWEAALAAQPAGAECKAIISNTPPLLQVEQAGLPATLHDAGRTGFRNRGVAVCGATAPFSARLANLLVGNNSGATVLELPQARYRFQVLEAAVFACTGGGLQPTLNGKDMPLNNPFWAPAGSWLELSKPMPGFRLYLAISGGWAAEWFLDSAATDLRLQRGGLLGRGLKKADQLQRHQPLTQAQQHLAELLCNGVAFTLPAPEMESSNNRLTVMPGPEWNTLSPALQQLVLKTTYTVGLQSNRTGWRLESSLPQQIAAGTLYSAPVTTGTVQYTPSGELLVLGPDAPNMGGYPRVLQLTATAMNHMAQLQPGGELQWEQTDNATAEKLYLAQEAELQRIAQQLQKWL